VCILLVGLAHTFWDALKLYPDPAKTIVEDFMSAVILQGLKN